MRIIQRVFLFFLFTSLPNAFGSEVNELLPVVHETFGYETEMEEDYIFLDEKQQDEIDKKKLGSAPAFLPYYKLTAKGDLVGYAVNYESMGRYHPFYFLLILDSDLTIKSVTVLEYHSPHGYEIKEPSFRNQFIGKSNKDPLKIGKDIDGISGATISSNSITDSIRLLVNYFETGMK